MKILTWSGWIASFWQLAASSAQRAPHVAIGGSGTEDDAGAIRIESLSAKLAELLREKGEAAVDGLKRWLGAIGEDRRRLWEGEAEGSQGLENQLQPLERAVCVLLGSPECVPGAGSADALLDWEDSVGASGLRVVQTLKQAVSTLVGADRPSPPAASPSPSGYEAISYLMAIGRLWAEQESLAQVMRMALCSSGPQIGDWLPAMLALLRRSRGIGLMVEEMVLGSRLGLDMAKAIDDLSEVGLAMSMDQVSIPAGQLFDNLRRALHAASSRGEMIPVLAPLLRSSISLPGLEGALPTQQLLLWRRPDKGDASPRVFEVCRLLDRARAAVQIWALKLDLMSPTQLRRAVLVEELTRQELAESPAVLLGSLLQWIPSLRTMDIVREAIEESNDYHQLSTDLRYTRAFGELRLLFTGGYQSTASHLKVALFISDPTQPHHEYPHPERLRTSLEGFYKTLHRVLAAFYQILEAGIGKFQGSELDKFILDLTAKPAPLFGTRGPPMDMISFLGIVHLYRSVLCDGPFQMQLEPWQDPPLLSLLDRRDHAVDD